MKKLLHKIRSFFWRNPSIKFKQEKENNQVRISVYWGRTTDVSDNFIAVLKTLYTYHPVQMMIRAALIRFGEKVDDTFFAHYIINLLDGHTVAEAAEFATEEIINPVPTNPFVGNDQDNNEPDDEELEENAKQMMNGVIDPRIFVMYHNGQGNL